MIEIKQSIAKEIADIISKEYPDAKISCDDITAIFEYPPDPAMGDLAVPCFKFSKTLRRSPIQIAESIKNGLNSVYKSDSEVYSIGKTESVGGYLNIYISDSYLSDKLLSEILTKGDSYGSQTFGEGKTVVLDYSSPNVAKPFHIGHLGTTIIGHSLKKLHQFAGYKCIGINYLGDWGTQFGKMIVAYRMWGNKEEVEKGGVDKLVELYVRFHNEAENNPELNDCARAEFHKLEEHDPENIALWKWFVEISLKEYSKTYKQLGIEFDSYAGESFYTDKMPAQVEKLREKKLLTIDDGASIVDLSKYGMPPCLILKRDGSTLYPTRDIAAAVYRKQTYNFDKCIYVTSSAQSLHFAQWFKVIELMGYDWADELVHVPYGTVSIGGEKLATRTGNVILLKNLFAMAIEKVREVIDEKNPGLENKDEISEAVGVGAIVFYYLLGNRIKDIDFRLEDALSFDGNTGPYVQYTYARTCSVIEKSKSTGIDYDSYTGGKITAPEEAALLKVLAKFPEKVISAIDDLEPSIITRYILDVAAEYNRFYHNCQILSANDPETAAFRLRLTRATGYVLGNAFELICMKKTPKI